MIAANMNDGSPRTVLLIEDDPAVSSTLADVLQASGFLTVQAESGAAARANLEDGRPDLIILDLKLPDADGLVLCSDLRHRFNVPIIICSGSSEKRDSILAFKLGADDFISKPFDVDELVARVEAVLRRSGPQGLAESPAAGPSIQAEHDREARETREMKVARVGELTVDSARRTVTLGGRAILLTPTEYRLLSALISRPDEVLDRQELAQIVWGYEDASIGRSIDVHMRRLRVKLASGAVPSPPIVSVRGFGYKIVAQADERAAS